MYALLYQPAVEHPTLPLGAMAVATAAGAPARVQDGRFDRDPPRERPLLVGLSVLSGAPIHDALRFAKAVRAAHPGVPLVWGGWHPSVMPEQTSRHPMVDAVVVGQGQASFAELLARAAAGAAFAGVAGTWVDGVAGPPRPMRSPEAFPSPDYALLDLERYFRAKGRRGLDYVSSQGCPFRCAFCSDPMVYGRSWHALPAARVLAEIGELARRHRVEDLAFQDDLFFVNRRRALDIAAGLAPLPLRWVATARAQQLAAMDPAELDLLRDSGLRRVTLGAESGSDATLTRLHKDQRAELLEEAAARLGERGIAASFSFIVGTPGEPPEELLATLDRIIRIKEKNPRTDTPLFRFTPYPGSDLVEELRHRGVPLPDSLEAWADCDFAGSRVAELSPEQERLVERFGTWAHFGWAPDRGTLRRALARLARARLRHYRVELPGEPALMAAIRRARQRPTAS